MNRSFQQELQADISKRFVTLSLFVSIVLFFLLFFFIFFVQKYQLAQESRQIVDALNHEKQVDFMLLEELNQQILPDYFKGQKDDSELLSDYYLNRSASQLRTELAVLNTAGELLFTSNRTGSPQRLPLNYLKTVITNIGEEDSFERITMDNNQNHLLLLFKRVSSNDDETIGFSVLLRNGTDFLQDELVNGTQYIIADSYDHVFSSSSNQYIEGYLQKVDSKQLQSPLAILDGQLFLHEKTDSDSLIIYTFLQSFPLQFLFLLLLLFSVSLTTLLIVQSMRLAKQIAQRNATAIDYLIAETKCISAGTKSSMSAQANDEFQFLAQNINTMLTQLRKLNNQKMVLEKQSIQFERKMLEAQFNPHFLYNTLETVRITMLIEPATAEALIHALTRVLKYSIGSAGRNTVIQSDMDILKDFLEVHAIRFAHLNYDIHIQEELKDKPIPSLVLLPLIENSLKYGLNYRTDLFIGIHIYRQGSYIIFEVVDNGPGFSPNAVRQHEKQLQSEETQHGLVNSYKRMCMTFRSVSIWIEREPDFTIVRMIVI